MKADVAIIIVSYNSADFIGACLESVISNRKEIRQQIIVVDNDSRDHSVAFIRECFPEVELLVPGANLGFAAGVNLGASHADAEFVLLLNPDTVILNHAVEAIVDFARSHPGHGLYGGRTLRPDGSLEPSSCWGEPSLWSMAMFGFGLTTLAPQNRWLDPESLGHWQRDSVREVGVITGCFLLAPKTVWDELGGMDERYFMYGEDVDLAMRARRLGYRPVICPQAELVHEVGLCSDTPVHKTMLLYRGKASLVRTHWRGPAKWLGLFFLAAGTGLRAALSAVLRKPREGDAAGRWQTLWRERATWLQGYSDRTAKRIGAGCATEIFVHNPYFCGMVSVVIPSYKRRDGMLALLADVYRQQGVDFEVIVVDDCSPDDSVEAIRREFPAVRLFVNESNAGPAVTRNRGIREARGELIVGFDSDVTVPDPQLLAKAAAYFRESVLVDGLALRIFKPDGIAEDVGRWWHPLPILDHADKEFFTSYFSGTAYAFRRDAMIGAGLFPELLCMHYEEVELAWRILDRGGRILHTPGIAVVHHANPVSRRSEVELFFKPRNQILLAVSCLPWPEALVFLLPRVSFQCFKALSRAHFLKFLKAMGSALTLLPRQLKLRNPLRRETFARIKKIKSSAAHKPQADMPVRRTA